ncbi:unnamed protein product [Caretta caretta]
MRERRPSIPHREDAKASLSVLKTGSDNNSTDIIFDVYNNNSIKNSGRKNRRSGPGGLLNNIISGYKIQQRRPSVLGSYTSKTALIKFLCDELKKRHFLEKLDEKTV